MKIRASVEWTVVVILCTLKFVGVQPVARWSWLHVIGLGVLITLGVLVIKLLWAVLMRLTFGGLGE